MNPPDGRFSLALLRIGNGEQCDPPSHQSVMHVEDGLTWSDALAALVARFGLATPDDAAARLGEAFRLDAGLAGTELSEINVNLPHRAVRIRYQRP